MGGHEYSLINMHYSCYYVGQLDEGHNLKKNVKNSNTHTPVCIPTPQNQYLQ